MESTFWHGTQAATACLVGWGGGCHSVTICKHWQALHFHGRPQGGTTPTLPRAPGESSRWTPWSCAAVNRQGGPGCQQAGPCPSAWAAGKCHPCLATQTLSERDRSLEQGCDVKSNHVITQMVLVRFRILLFMFNSCELWPKKYVNMNQRFYILWFDL